MKRITLDISPDVPEPWQGTTDQLCPMDGHEYRVALLIAEADEQGLPVMEIPLAHLCTNKGAGADTCEELAGHVKKVVMADLRYPILLSPDGRVMDGAHRIAKAILTGKPTVKARRFRTWPRPETQPGGQP